MLIFAIDDEPKMLRLLHRAIAEAEPDAEIMDFEDDELLKKAYRRLARAGYKLNVYYTERSAGFYIDAMLAADNGDIKNEDALREQGDEFAKKAKQAMLASQRYDKRSRQVK